MFLKSISNFRGIAIILIVAGHLYFTGFNNDHIISSLVRNIITGGTALFVFISGFMFHYIFYKRYEYKKFIINKIKNVGVPYLLLGSICISLFYIISNGYFDSVDMINYNGRIFQEGDSILTTILKYFYTGDFLIAYWYIPFALLLFLSAPLHMKFITLKPKKQLIILSFLYLISLMIHRPLFNMNPFHSLIYYTPIYLIGIMVSIHSDKVKQLLEDKLLLLFFGVILMSFLEYATGGHGNYHKDFFKYNGIDFLFIQKTFLVFFFYILLEKYTINSKTLDVISQTSFAVFFIHPWFLAILTKIFRTINPISNYINTLENYNFLIYTISVVFVLFFSVLIAVFIKKIFKNSKKTRYIIGY